MALAPAMGIRRAAARALANNPPAIATYKCLEPAQAITDANGYCGTGAHPPLANVPWAMHPEPHDPPMVSFTVGAYDLRRILLEVRCGVGSFAILVWEMALNAIDAVPGVVPLAHPNTDIRGRPVGEVLHVLSCAILYGNLPGYSPRGRWFERAMDAVLRTVPGTLPFGLPPGTALNALFHVAGSGRDGEFLYQQMWCLLEYKVLRASWTFTSGFAYVQGTFYLKLTEYAAMLTEIAAGRGECGFLYVGIEMAGGDWYVMRRSIRAQVDSMFGMQTRLVSLADDEEQKESYECSLRAPVARLAATAPPFPPKPVRRRGLLDAMVWRLTMPEQGPYADPGLAPAARYGNPTPPPGGASPNPPLRYTARRGTQMQGGITSNNGIDEFISSVGWEWVLVIRASR